jgi:hypothetical protein
MAGVPVVTRMMLPRALSPRFTPSPPSIMERPWRGKHSLEERAFGNPPPIPHMDALAVAKQMVMREAGSVTFRADELTSDPPGELTHLSRGAAYEHAGQAPSSRPRGHWIETPADCSEQRSRATRADRGNSKNQRPERIRTNCGRRGSKQLVVFQQIFLEDIGHALRWSHDVARGASHTSEVRSRLPNSVVRPKIYRAWNRDRSVSIT